LASVRADTERQLAIKADKRDVETAVPMRMEDLLRTLNGEIKDMKVDLARKATKEEFHVLATEKVSPCK
jgi:hypothetical protein